MILFGETKNITVFFYNQPVNMCCQFNGLTEIVQTKMKRKSESGDVFLFRNKKGDYVKFLYHDETGICLSGKRLYGSRFDFDLALKRMDIRGLEMFINSIAAEIRPPLMKKHSQAVSMVA